MSPKSTVVLWREIHEIADKVCEHFGLSYGRILPETRMRARHYGECWPCQKCINDERVDETNCNEKIIYIRVHQVNRPRRPLAASTILHTLAHELAHLRVWRHGPAFDQMERDILDYMLELGYEVL
jgi:hypothetical protein